jgi:Ca2+-binding RTX toxin-like protein
VKPWISTLMAACVAAVTLAPAFAAEPVPVTARGRACTVEGTAGEDRDLRGTGGRDVICGKGGDDRILALAGSDIVFGGSGDDAIDGGGGSDALKAGPGRDLVYAGPGNDRLLGGGGNEKCLYSIGGGTDRIVGGPGTDRYRADGPDTVVSAERAIPVCPFFPPF